MIPVDQHPTDLDTVIAIEDEQLIDFGRTAASAGKWSLVSQLGRQAVRMLFTFVLARLLGPANFGVISLATVYIAFTTLFLDTGFATALVQRERITSADIGTSWALNMALAISMALATLIFAPWIATFFHEQQLVSVLRVLAILVVVKGTSTIPAALLLRQLRFRSMALCEIITGVIGGVVGVSMAFAGTNYWSLVGQSLATEVTYAIGALMLVRTLGGWPTRTSLRDMWRFSANAAGAHAVGYAMRNADNLLVGRYLGATPLAQYALSYRVMMLPLQMLSNAVIRVALPMYSRKQNDRRYLRDNFLLTTRMVSLATFPIMAWVVIASPQLVPLAFGNAWHAAVVPMQLLALAGLRQSVQTLVEPILVACGRTDWQFRMGIVWSASAIAGFAVGLQWGINGVAGAYLVVDVLIAPVMIAMTAKVLDFRIRQYLATFIAPAVAALTLLVAYLVMHLALSRWGAPLFVDTAVSSMAALVAYGVVLLVVWPGEVEMLRVFSRRFLRRAV